jgi:hypothetical protein
MTADDARGLSDRACRVYDALVEYKAKHGRDPYQSTLAKRMGKHLKYVQRGIRELIEAGAITMEKQLRGGDGLYERNRYTVNRRTNVSTGADQRECSKTAGRYRWTHMSHRLPTVVVDQEQETKGTEVKRRRRLRRHALPKPQHRFEQSPRRSQLSPDQEQQLAEAERFYRKRDVAYRLRTIDMILAGHVQLLPTFLQHYEADLVSYDINQAEIKKLRERRAKLNGSAA